MNERRSTVWTLLAITILFDGVLLSMAPEARPLDAHFTYTPDEALRYVETLTDADRNTYRLFNGLDFGFMAVYSALFLTWIRSLQRRGGLPSKLAPAWGLLPGALDLVETGAIAVLLHYPPGSAAAAVIAAMFTPLKWCTVATVIGLLVIGEVRARRGRPDSD